MDNKVFERSKLWVPTDDAKAEIIETIWSNRVTIIAGETGSGRTSRIPLYLDEAGFSADGYIGITEPRRIIVKEMAHYVASLLGEQVGRTVGYRIRFSDYTTVNTRIKYLTDGMLLAELMRDKLLSEYSVVMIDEAHERSIVLDLLLALLKRLLTIRPDLKVIVSSATIDEYVFSDFFDTAPVINVSGRMYPVEVSYKQNGSLHSNRMQSIVREVVDIHESGLLGDILVFQAGTNEIYGIIRELEARGLQNIAYFPVHATLDFAEQQRIFCQYPGIRKVIAATNIAETGITIQAKLHVIDSGYVKVSSYDPVTGALSLSAIKHSKAGCTQRAGRAGRVDGGTCRRMYTESDFESRNQSHTPDILRHDLAAMVLKLEYLGISDIDSMSFLDTPKVSFLVDAYETLFALGALYRDDEGLPAGITPDGRIMARLPLHPSIGRMILDARRYGCTQEIVTVASFMLHEGRFMAVHRGSEETVREIETSFNNPQSDALKLLEIWSQYEASGYSSTWCRSNALQEHTMEEIRKTRHQVLETLSDFDIDACSSYDPDVICKAFAHGLIRNLFVHDHYGMFNGIFRKKCRGLRIHPSSSIFSKNTPEGLLIVASNIFRTRTLQARLCGIVRPEWLCEFDPASFSMRTTLAFDRNGSEFTICKRTELMYEKKVLYTSSLPIPQADMQCLTDEQIREAGDGGFEILTFRLAKNGKEYIAALPDNTIVHKRAIEPGAYVCKIHRERHVVYAEPVYRIDI